MTVYAEFELNYCARGRVTAEEQGRASTRGSWGAEVNEGECAEVLKAPFVHCHELANALGDGDYDGKNKEVYYNTVGTKGEINMASVALGFNTLLVDGDIVFLQNPMPLLADMVAKHPSVDAWAQVRATPPCFRRLAGSRVE